MLLLWFVKRRVSTRYALVVTPRAVSASDVLRAARDFLHPEELQLVAVGDPAVIRGPLAAIDLGPLQTYDATGNSKG